MSAALPPPSEAVQAVTVCAELLTLGDTACAHSAPSEQPAASHPHVASPTVWILLLVNKRSSGRGVAAGWPRWPRWLPEARSCL